MLTAFILVCSLATISNNCTRDNALDVVYVPATFESPAACMMRAQAYVADSSLGRDLRQNEAFKVICVRCALNRVNKAESDPGAGRANLAAPFRGTVQRRTRKAGNNRARLVRQRRAGVFELLL